MELQEMLQVIRRRLWVIVLGTLVVSVAAFVVSELRTPVYQAKVTMIINQTTGSPLADLELVTTGKDLAQTYSQLLKTRPLLEIVIANLDLALTPEELVEKRIDTNLIPGTQLLELTVKDMDPKRASDIANEIAFTFISLHNAEQQLESIAELEQDIGDEIAYLKELIRRNRIVMNQLRTPPGLSLGGESNPIEETLAGQQNAYASLLGTYLEVRSLQTQLLDVTVVEPAVPPTKPVGRSAAFYALLGAVIGLGLNGGLVMLLEYLDRYFETSDDVSQVLSLPTLGAIPRLGSKDWHGALVTSVGLDRIASEAYRTLRTNIRFASIDKPLTTLLVTGAEPEVGKTVSTGNLGVVCAQAGLQIVLIDADLRQPSLHQVFDLDNDTGLTNLLVGDVQNVQECMLKTEIDNLRLVTSGPIPPNPSELLGSKRMEAVLAQIRENADLVILDSPPLLAVTDAAVLATKVDGVLLTVTAKQTSHEAASRACEALQSVGAPLMGVVLVKVKRRRSTYYYYSVGAKSARRQIRKLPNWITRFQRER